MVSYCKSVASTSSIMGSADYFSVRNRISHNLPQLRCSGPDILYNLSRMSRSFHHCLGLVGLHQEVYAGLCSAIGQHLCREECVLAEKVDATSVVRCWLGTFYLSHHRVILMLLFMKALLTTSAVASSELSMLSRKICGARVKSCGKASFL